MGNEKGDVREAAGILSVIKCRKGAHDAEDEAHDLNTMMAGRQAGSDNGHCGNIVTPGDKFQRKHRHLGRAGRVRRI